MYKKSRKKIVASIMSILVLLWAGTLGMIYASSYFEMSRQNERMLEAHSDMYTLPDEEADMPPERPEPGDSAPGDGEPGFTDSPRFMMANFYTVALSDGGEVLAISNESPTVYSDDELEALAKSIADSGTQKGSEGNLAFYAADKGRYTLVTFMDNTVINESAATLLRYTFIFGGAALIVFFFISLFLAKNIVRPLEESYRKQKQFISDAGHELKTPVSVVNANAELLARELGENQWLSNIQHENERMGVLVTQLLELARAENVQPQMERLDLSHLVCGEVLPFESVAFEAGLLIESRIQEGILTEGSSAELKQLVSILVDNAIRHGSAGGNVSVSLSKEHGDAVLSVTNAGDEIPEEQREQIFERFYRADESRNSGSGHYGLGLAIAKAIADSHRGSIKVLCHDGLVEFRVQLPAE